MNVVCEIVGSDESKTNEKTIKILSQPETCYNADFIHIEFGNEKGEFDGKELIKAIKKAMDI